MIVKIKLDDWAKNKLRGRLGIKSLATGKQSMDATDHLIWLLLQKEDGDTMDLTKEAGKLANLLEMHE